MLISTDEIGSWERAGGRGGTFRKGVVFEGLRVMQGGRKLLTGIHSWGDSESRTILRDSGRSLASGQGL